MEEFFESVWGQESAIRVMVDNLAKERLASSYLLSGAEGTFKIKSALIFAKLLLCKSPTKKGCGCKSCIMFDKGTHPDFMGITPTGSKSENKNYHEIVRNPELIGMAKAGRAIKVEQIRVLIDALSLKSYASGRKVVVVEGAETMNQQTANAFLKTLEEPPDDTVILMVSSNSSTLLPTIISRCRVLRFIPMKPEALAEKISSLNGISFDEALHLAELAEGRPETALGDGMEETQEIDNIAIDIVSNLTSMGADEIIEIAGELKSQRGKLPLLIKRMMEAIRNGITGGRIANFEGLDEARLVDAYFSLLDSLPATVYNPNVQLFIESTIFNMQSIMAKGVSIAERTR